jgi:hypothetical protein
LKKLVGAAWVLGEKIVEVVGAPADALAVPAGVEGVGLGFAAVVAVGGQLIDDVGRRAGERGSGARTPRGRRWAA